MNHAPSPSQIQESVNRYFLQKAIEEIEREELANHREEMALQRCEACGRWFHGTSPTTGRLLSYQSRCGDYRRCPYCRNLRADKMTREILKGTDRAIFVGEFDPDDWDSTRRRWERWGVNYRRIPISEGIISKLHDCHLIIFDQPRCRSDAAISLPLESLPEVNYDLKSILDTALERVPLDSRMSGGLGIAEEKDHDGEELVNIELVLTDAEPEVRRRAWEVAIQKTSYLNPTSPFECEQACQERTAAFKEALDFLGANIIDSLWIKRYVAIVGIDWSTPIRLIATSKKPEPVPLDRESLGWYKSGVPIGTIPSGALP